MKRLPELASFVLFIALCVSLAFWTMQLFKPPARAVTAPPPAATEVDLQAAAGLFGGRSTVAAASNFQLKGVVAAEDGGDSVAILSANGKPAQAVRQGAEIVPGTVVKEVHKRYVLVSEGGVPKRVDLPEKAPSSILASPIGSNAPAPAPSVRPNPSSNQPVPAVTVGPSMPVQQSMPGAPANPAAPHQ